MTNSRNDEEEELFKLAFLYTEKWRRWKVDEHPDDLELGKKRLAEALVFRALNKAVQKTKANLALASARKGAWEDLAKYIEAGNQLTPEIRKFLAEILGYPEGDRRAGKE